VVLANLRSESETCVGSRVHLVGGSISFEKNFYWLPFTPPSGSPFWSFKWYQSQLRVLIDSNQSIQGWRTRNGVRVLHTSMAKTTRCGVSEWRHSSAERVRSFGMSRWTQVMSNRCTSSSRIEGHVRRQQQVVDYLFRALCQPEFDRVLNLVGVEGSSCWKCSGSGSDVCDLPERVREFHSSPQ
jgi:hypothetical protein